MASLDDILTTQKNGVIAINGLIQANSKTLGTITSLSVTSPTLIVTGPGRLVNISVNTTGSTIGEVYDEAAFPVTASNLLAAIPTAANVHIAGVFFTNGLIVVPGTGQSVNVTYYLGT